jgi:hypothetical protein
VGEIKGSAFIFRVNGLKFVGQKEWADNGILADITFLELFPVVISVHIWGIHLHVAFIWRRLNALLGATTWHAKFNRPRNT